MACLSENVAQGKEAEKEKTEREGREAEVTLGEMLKRAVHSDRLIIREADGREIYRAMWHVCSTTERLTPPGK